MQKSAFYLTDNAEEMNLSYVGLTDTNKETLKQKLLKLYDESLEKDLNLGYTTVGYTEMILKLWLTTLTLGILEAKGNREPVP